MDATLGQTWNVPSHKKDMKLNDMSIQEIPTSRSDILDFGPLAIDRLRRK